VVDLCLSSAVLSRVGPSASLAVVLYEGAIGDLALVGVIHMVISGNSVSKKIS